MTNNRFDVEILVTTKKKWNIYIIVIFVLLLFLSVFSISNQYYLLILIWAVVAAIFLLYQYKHSKSLIELSTKLLFNDDGFSIVIEDNNFNLQLKKDSVTHIIFDKKNNHVIIFQYRVKLYEFLVKPKSLIDLYEVFNNFGYNCELISVI